MPTILISGAAYGLGSAFLDAYRKHDAKIIAIDKQGITCSDDKVRTYAVDVTNETSIHAFTEDIKDEPIDLVIHSAGIRGLVPHLEIEKHGNVDACETLEAMDLPTMMNTFAINAAGTFSLFRAILPNLRLGTNAKVIVMSSRMGSLSNNAAGNRAAGSAYAYRASKAALNAIVRSFVVDVPDVAWVMCHPGRVETKLVKWKEEGAISSEESVAGLLPLIEGWSSSDSGCFYDRFGETIPW
ncbi:hypothetical protein LTR56_017607 [Elasticomyces elasticus]|nr:hypothetical protein LTR56_017607 [Elasticomyces elasticus]KAK3630790.1 hypothetical protein LTR22_021369 [Elasticomyces elasticus]KAK4909204.1 hypothetical protein LTR49_022027 [Elasticomyces elasticus]KAK5749265.1 hypothetical protein LTS12_020645 [Elasticomyces elasticus]